MKQLDSAKFVANHWNLVYMYIMLFYSFNTLVHLAVLENREKKQEAQFLVPDGGIQSTMV